MDDDIDLKNMRPLDDDELDLYHLAEDGPQIAGIIDERPDDMRTLEEFRGSRRWKVMSDEFGIEDIRVTALEYGNNKIVTSLPSKNHGKSDLVQERGLDSSRESKKTSSKHLNSDYSPVRKCEGDLDITPPRRSRVRSDSDVSPTRKLQAQRGLGVLLPKKDGRETDSDSSPSRKNRHSPASLKRSKLEVSPQRKEKSKRELSPVRKNKRNAELPLTRKYNHDSEKPVSTLRKTKYGGSPSRKNKYHNLSPPRKSRMQNDFDTSPPRKPRRSEEYDDTPPRNSRKHGSKINRDQRRCSDSDVSPPRKTPRHGLPSKDSSRTLSSFKTSRNSDANHPEESHTNERIGSFAIKSKQGDFKKSDKTNKDLSVITEFVSPSRHRDRSESPYRKDRHRSSPDLPPRKTKVLAHSRNSSGNSPQRVSKMSRNAASPSTKRSDYDGRGRIEDKYGHQDRSDKTKGRMEKTLDGKRAGLQAAGELRQELSDFRRREDELFTEVSITITL